MPLSLRAGFAVCWERLRVVRGLGRTVIALVHQLRRWLLAGVARTQPRRCQFCPRLHGCLFAALQLGIACRAEC